MEFWYRKKLPWYALLLLPLSKLVSLITQRKRHRRRLEGYAVPVLVVGNITVGGTGKTPMIQYIAALCTQNSLKVGIVSRGYGGKSDEYPLTVQENTLAQACGDEPKLLSNSLNVPVVVSPDRHAAVNHLLMNFEVDLIISDDGLQHYNMARDLELVMIDGERGLGNGLLLPAGPLREAESRLTEANLIVSKGTSTTGLAINAETVLQVENPQNIHKQTLSNADEIELVTAIGYGKSFLRSVEQLGYRVSKATFLTDHAVIPQTMLSGSMPVVITEKDAVKLDLNQYPNVYVAPLRFTLPPKFNEQLLTLIREKINEKSSHHPS